MARHHIVQDKYLTQWRKADTENQLNIFLIPENKYIERGPGWKGFWREDFNVLDDEDGRSYVPEDIAAIVDSKGIEAIRKIDAVNETQLSGEDRSAVAFYVALQYIRTPRFREETDKAMHAVIQYLMRQDISSPDKVSLTKENYLREPPKNKREEEAMEKISKMSEEEIRQAVFDTIHGDILRSGLTKTGHSKSILKVDRLAKGLFDVQWVFLVAPSGTSFITSDNPCFTISPTRIMNGLLSPKATVIFPLRPDLCIYIKPAIKSHTEHRMRLSQQQVRAINSFVLLNSYQCAIAKEKAQLEDLVQEFDIEGHRKTRGVTVSKSGPYTFFNIE